MDVARVNEIVLEILTMGLLRIRVAGWAGRPEECALVADHLHNLPDLLRTGKDELLRFYLTTERSEFANRVGDVREFTPLWEELERHLTSRPNG